MRTKTVEVSPTQVRVEYVSTSGMVLAKNAKIGLIDCDIDPSLITKIRFPVLEVDDADDNKDLKVKITYLDLTDSDKKYASKIKNWISAKTK
jgi:hypothetical protein